jgi:hypothetical protein
MTLTADTLPQTPPATGAPSLATLTRHLHDVARRIGHADALAAFALPAVIAQLRAHPDPRATGLMIFAKAMAERLSDSTAEVASLYLRRFEVPQIQLFNLLGQHVPMARMATRIANDLLATAIAGQPHPTLIDIGIGTGRQFSALLDELAAAGTLPPALTVIGIEPAEDALARAREMLEAQAARLGVALRFVGLAAGVESLAEADWARIAATCTAPPAINAAFALHHIADAADGGDRRNAALQRLAALRPACLVLAEPDVDHLEHDYATRFGHCITHFGAVFRVLDALPLQQGERDALKVGFFGREIADILGSAEAQRSERHEPAERWMRRLQATGFEPAAPDVALPDSGQPTIRAQRRDGHIAITGAGEPLVALIAARPTSR